MFLSLLSCDEFWICEMHTYVCVYAFRIRNAVRSSFLLLITGAINIYRVTVFIFAAVKTSNILKFVRNDF
jgi:hypothetical protein